jgi:hypothetical protein
VVMGVWHQEPELTSPSLSQMPIGGIMFLGNDFGTLQSFETPLRRGYENSCRSTKSDWSVVLEEFLSRTSLTTVSLSNHRVGFSGPVFAKGRAQLRKHIAEIIEDADANLTPRMRTLLDRL